jgi:hypothetical protein
VQQDIVNAVAQGKVVIVPAQETQRAGFAGVGYVIIDEGTGAGAFLIDGGANGAILLACASTLVPVGAGILLSVALAAITVVSIEALAIGATAALTIAVGATIVSFGVAATYVGVLSALIVGVLVAAYDAAKAIGVAMAKSFAEFADCSCSEHYANCITAGWDQRIGQQGLCQLCADKCRVEGDWPVSVPIFGGGPVNAKAYCSYWEAN